MLHDLVGQSLGNYRLTRLLGEGEFVQTYLGEHVFLKKLTAVKVLQGRVTAEMQADFLKEAQLIASLEHPHIVRVLDFGVEHQLSFLMMSYAPNGTLRQRHPEGSQLPLTTIGTYLQQIAAALQYAHEHHVIHRDVKPQNMLIGNNDEILLGDFGLAIIFESTFSQNLLQQPGILTYMAPEQFQGKAYPASDQYALAVVAYEWLCDAPPFHGANREIAIQQQFAPPPLLHEKVPAIPTELEQVVLKALAKDPRERFACVQDFATAFDQACHLSLHVEMDSAGPSPRPSISPLSSPVSAQVSRSKTTPFRLKSIPTRIRILLSLVLLIALGGISLFSQALITHHAGVSVTATSQPSVVATAAAQAYATGTSQEGVMSGFDAQQTGFNPYERVLNASNVSHMLPDWTASTGNNIVSSPAVVSGVVYIGSEDGKLYAFDASNGKLRWAAPTGAAIISSPAVVNRVVYIGSNDGKLYAFDASTGKLLWASPTGDPMSSSPVVVNGVVYTDSDGSNLYAFAAFTGKRLWASPLGSTITLSPAVANNTVYVISYGFDLYAFNASTGKLRWSTVNAPISFEGSSAPIVANNVVYAGSGDGKLYAFDASTGKLRWSTSTAPAISLAIANNVVYAGSHDGKLYAFDASTGRLRWSTFMGNDTTSPTVANGVIYIGPSYNLYAFDASSGKRLWAASIGGVYSLPSGGIYSSPVVANGVVYIGSIDGKLYAFHLPDQRSR